MSIALQFYCLDTKHLYAASAQVKNEQLEQNPTQHIRMYDVITKKKHGMSLTKDEINSIIKGFVKGDIPHEQMSALLMAIWSNGMTDEETTLLTIAMRDSGDIVDLSTLPGFKVDKHSTGGVGDKTTLVIEPDVAACGVTVAKMSGRGLRHTGGTIDKLESIPGFRIDLSREEFFDIVKKHGLAVTGQSGDLAPADKKIYALRDVTATVDSIPLIASSIMSKKLALGSDGILLDVTVGSGAFMKNYADALKLALCMASIGNSAGRATAVLVTDMDTPLGNTIGNALELSEAIDVLKGQGPKDLREVCIELAAAMLQLAGKGTLQECRAQAIKVLDNGAAYAKLCAMVAAQGGNVAVIHHPELLPKARFQRENQGSEIRLYHSHGCGTVRYCLYAAWSRPGKTWRYFGSGSRHCSSSQNR